MVYIKKDLRPSSSKILLSYYFSTPFRVNSKTIMRTYFWRLETVLLVYLKRRMPPTALLMKGFFITSGDKLLFEKSCEKVLLLCKWHLICMASKNTVRCSVITWRWSDECKYGLESFLLLLGHIPRVIQKFLICHHIFLQGKNKKVSSQVGDVIFHPSNPNFSEGLIIQISIVHLFITWFKLAYTRWFTDRRLKKSWW